MKLVVRLIAVALFVSTMTARPASAQEKASDWMKNKARMSHAILDGLTDADFVKIELNAQKMNVINFLEKMVATDKPEYKEYMRQLNAFETATRELLRQSAAKNIEGATLAYTQLTVSCVQCHKILRDAKKQ